jgi:hypothetical protein
VLKDAVNNSGMTVDESAMFELLDTALRTMCCDCQTSGNDGCNPAFSRKPLIVPARAGRRVPLGHSTFPRRAGRLAVSLAPFQPGRDVESSLISGFLPPLAEALPIEHSRSRQTPVIRAEFPPFVSGYHGR